MCVYTCKSCYIYLNVAEYPFDYFLEYLLISRPVPSVFSSYSRSMCLPCSLVLCFCVELNFGEKVLTYEGTQRTGVQYKGSYLSLLHHPILFNPAMQNKKQHL